MKQSRLISKLEASDLDACDSSITNAQRSGLPGLIIVLGSPNDECGRISEVGQGRLLTAINEFALRQNSGWKILLTGGYGQHFNATSRPHAYYARKFLIERGISADKIVDFAESRDTVDDAIQAAPIVARLGADELLVVTSDFHRERVSYIFKRVFPEQRISFSVSNYLAACDPGTAAELIAHEERELASLRASGRSALVRVALPERD